MQNFEEARTGKGRLNAWQAMRYQVKEQELSQARKGRE